MYANTTKVITFITTLLTQRRSQHYITSSNYPFMTLTLNHIVKCIFSAMSEKNTKDVKMYYDILSRIMLDNVVLRLHQELNDVIRMTANYLINEYSNNYDRQPTGVASHTNSFTEVQRKA